MLDLSSFLRGVLFPGILAGAGLAVVWRPWRRPPTETALPKRSWSGFFFALAFFAACAALFGAPPTPFGARVLAGGDWLLWIALVAGPLVLVDTALRRLALLTRTLLVLGMLFGVLRAMLRYHWESGEAALWLVGLAALFAMVWSATAALARRQPGASLPAVLLLTATGLALCAGLSGSAKLGQTGGAFCACLGAALIIALWRPSFRLDPGDVIVVVLVLFGIGLCAYFYSELSGLDALLLGACPLAAWAGELPLFRNRTPRQRTLLRTLMALLPVAAAVTRAALAFDPDPYGDYGDYDYED